MRDAAGADENHTVGFVVVGDVCGQVGLGDGEDVFLRAEDGAAERLILERGGMQVVKHNFLELLIDLFLLAQDHVALALDGGLLELGVLQDVGEDLDGFADVVLERLGVVDGVFALETLMHGQRWYSPIGGGQRWTYRGVGIQMTAHVLDLELQLVLRPSFCALWKKKVPHERGFILRYSPIEQAISPSP